MSIESFGGIHTPVCDICGDELTAEFDFYEAVSAKKAAGWISRKVNGYWEDVCPACRQEELRQKFS